MHIIGGEMTYRYISTDAVTGKKTFEFTLVVYRDCAGGGAQLDTDAPIGIYRGNALAATLVDNFEVPIGLQEQVIPFIPPCTDPGATNGTCAQRGVYTFTRELTVSATESYFVIYQRCCRTNAIANIDNPNSHGATYMAELTPAAQAGNNSSPVFKNYPPTFICAGFNIAFNHAASDADGDSLVYVFCNPLDGGGNSGGGGGTNCNSPTPNPPCGPAFDLVPFTGSYTFEEPMGGNPLIMIDSMTGLLDGVPEILGKFVVGICVLEYRNGVLIGSTLRDFQFNVVDCTPTVFADILEDSLPIPGHFFIERCGQNPVKIINQSPPTPDLQTYFWEFDLNNGTKYTAATPNVTVPLPAFGIYHGQLFLNRGLNCPDSALVTIIAHPGAKADFSYKFDSCALTPAEFTDLSSSATAGGLTNWAWTFYDPNTASAQQNPIYGFSEKPGDYLTRLIVTDTDNCRDTVSKLVMWQPKPPPPIPNLTLIRLCLPEKAVFDTIFDPTAAAGMDFTWDFGDGSTSAEPNPVHSFALPGIYDVSVFIKTIFNCTATDTFPGLVRTDAKPRADFDFSPKTGISNINPTVQFTNESDPTVVLWRYDFGGLGGSNVPDPVFEFPDTGKMTVQLVVTNLEGCLDTATQRLDVVPMIRLYFPNVFNPEKSLGVNNDVFKVIGLLPGFSDYEMTIWSRWGELLFQSNDPEEGWNGRRRGSSKTQMPGVYTWYLHLNGPRGEPYEFTGTVTLVE